MKSLHLFNLSALCLSSLFLSLPLSLRAQREEVNLNNWLFSHDSISWQNVTVPHDWAISGPFDKKWDLQYVAIEQNNEKVKSEKSGRSGALPWIGKGYYKTTFALKARNKRVFLAFDGAMSNAHVKVNGKDAGYWPYGYNAFRMEITNLVKIGTNTISVSLNNMEESSRWYPGAGIYRPVTLVYTSKMNLDPWTTFIRTVTADKKEATVNYSTAIKGLEKGGKTSVDIVILDADNNKVATDKINSDAQGMINSSLTIDNPHLWSPEIPYLYKVVARLCNGNKCVDTQTTTLGIRTISFSKEHGFQLNGVTRKFKGVCLHHDLGPLGAAENKAALIRQVRILKDMGCDAIRTSHNMPSAMQMEVYDSLGMMVMGESFDTWVYPKVKNGYAKYFKDWSDKDIENLVLNNRNHPSLVMYSIGNEIPEQGSKEGPIISKRLQDICHRLDSTRPVTQGMDRAESALKTGFAQVMDVPGWNYRVQKYDKNIKVLPQGFQLGSETASTVSSRGVYKFPVVLSDNAVYPDGQCSSYDTEWCSWSNLPDVDFMIQDDRTNTIGQFVWTGFDYLGEPTPYDTYWPSRSSYFGIVDLAGLPKDRYYLYRSVWNTKEHTIHLLPHWNWKGREGQVTPVYCYTDYPQAELFVNGKSQGHIHKTSFTVDDASRLTNTSVIDSLLDRYRLRWNNVKYEPGELRVVVYDANGQMAGETSVYTAGEETSLNLVADKTSISSDGNDLSYITVSMVDDKGVLCPESSDELTFDVTGAGRFKCVCNGDATSLETFTEPRMKLFNGRLVVTVQSNGQKGDILLRVKSADGKFEKTICIKSE